MILLNTRDVIKLKVMKKLDLYLKMHSVVHPLFEFSQFLKKSQYG